MNGDDSNNIISIATKAGGKEQAMEGVDLYRNGKKRVVITGIGAITALGNDVDEFYVKLFYHFNFNKRIRIIIIIKNIMINSFFSKIRSTFSKF